VAKLEPKELAKGALNSAFLLTTEQGRNFQRAHRENTESDGAAVWPLSNGGGPKVPWLSTELVTSIFVERIAGGSFRCELNREAQGRG